MEFRYKFNLTLIGFDNTKEDLQNLKLVIEDNKMPFIINGRNMYFKLRKLIKMNSKNDSNSSYITTPMFTKI